MKLNSGPVAFTVHAEDTQINLFKEHGWWIKSYPEFQYSQEKTCVNCQLLPTTEIISQFSRTTAQALQAVH